MAFLPLLGAGLGLVGSIFGANAQNNATNAASQATAGQNAINQQQLQLYQNQEQNFQNNYEPLIPGLASAYNGLDTMAGPYSQGAFGNMESYLSNPNGTATGSYGPYALQQYYAQGQQGLGNTPAYMQAADYYANPQATSLAMTQPALMGGYGSLTQGPQTQQAVTPYALQQEYKTSQMGMDPAAWTAAEQGVANQTSQNINNIERNLGSGMPNAIGMAGDAANAGLGARAGVDAQLATQNAQIQQEGLQGLETAASGLDTSTLNYMNAGLGGLGATANARDAQTQAMLSLGSGLGFQNLQTMDTGLGATMQTASGMDAQTLAMLEQAYNMPMGALTSGQGFVGQGQNYLPGVQQGMQGISNQYATAAQNAAAGAAGYNPFASLSSGLASWAPYFPQGGGGGGGTVNMGNGNLAPPPSYPQPQPNYYNTQLPPEPTSAGYYPTLPIYQTA